MQSGGVNLWYLKLRLFDRKEFMVELSKVYDVGLQKYRNQKWECVKKNQSFARKQSLSTCLLSFNIDIIFNIFYKWYLIATSLFMNNPFKDYKSTCLVGRENPSEFRLLDIEGKLDAGGTTELDIEGKLDAGGSTDFASGDTKHNHIDPVRHEKMHQFARRVNFEVS